MNDLDDLVITVLDGLKCEQCGAAMKRGRGGPPPRFCSQNCIKLAHVAKQGIRHCMACSKPVPLSTTKRLFCSKNCISVHRSKPTECTHPLVQWCKQCGNLIRDWRKKNYCSQKCRDHKHRNRKKTYVAFERSANCKICEKEFNGTGRGKLTFCSSECRLIDKRLWRLDMRRKRRARKKLVRVESISRKRVFERDSWKCGICLCQIDKAAKYPDLKSASLDHIIPIAKGGSHTYDNVQAAHFICNSFKSDRLLAK